MTNLQITWNGDTAGKGVIKGDGLDAEIAIPEVSGGSGKGADPKELLVSSAAACYTMTLVAMVQARKLPVTDFSMTSETVDSGNEELKIIHHPHINLSSDASEKDEEAAKRIFMTADKGCAVGNLLKKAGTQIEGTVFIESGKDI